jgi:hypothetical protein
MKPIKNTRVGFTLLIVLVTQFVLMVPAALAAEFYGIVDPLGKRSRGASMNVSVDNVAGPTDVTFDMFGASGPLSQFTVRTNALGFASTSSNGDLLTLSGGQPFLIRARTGSNAAPAAAMLQIELQNAPMTFGLSPAAKRDGSAFSIGTEFNISLGSYRSAYLLVANVGGGEQVVDVFKGTRGADGTGIFSNPRLDTLKIWRVDLTQNESLSNLVISSTGPIIVQAILDDGKNIHAFQVLPSV